MASTNTAIIPFQPSSVTEALELSEKLSASQLLPTALQKRPSDVLVVLLTGQELGLSAMQAIRGIHVIQGRGCTSAETLVGLVRRSGVCEYFRCVESNERRAVYETRRKGDTPTRLEWTMEQAKRAGLAGKDNWQKFPAQMLRARCKADLCRTVYEDVVQGMLTKEEAVDGVFETTTAIDAEVIPITIADKSAEEWQREGDSLVARIQAAPDTSTLEALLPELRVMPDDLLRPLREAYAKRLAELAPPNATSKTQAAKDKLRAKGGNGTAEPPKTITVEGVDGEVIATGTIEKPQS